ISALGEAMRHRILLALLVPCGLVAATSSAAAMGCCAPRQTFRQVAQTTPIIFYGTLIGPRKPVGFGCTTGASAQVVVGKVVQDRFGALHSNFQVDRIAQETAEGHYLFLCECIKDKIVPFSAIPASEAMISYFNGALAVDRKKRAAQMVYFFNYLEHA